MPTKSKSLIEPGLEIKIEGTCSAAWPHIGFPVFDGVDEGVTYWEFDQIAELNSTHLVKNSFRRKSPDFAVNPSAFKKAHDYERTMAYANLFAAAPELLDAAKKAVAFLDRQKRIVSVNGEPTCYDALVAAIAKAEPDTDHARQLKELRDIASPKTKKK